MVVELVPIPNTDLAYLACDPEHYVPDGSRLPAYVTPAGEAIRAAYEAGWVELDEVVPSTGGDGQPQWVHLFRREEDER